MKVSELSNELNTTAETVRHYTRIGYLKPSVNQMNGYKQYGSKEQHKQYLALHSLRDKETG